MLIVMTMNQPHQKQYAADTITVLVYLKLPKASSLVGVKHKVVRPFVAQANMLVVSSKGFLLLIFLQI